MAARSIQPLTSASRAVPRDGGFLEPAGRAPSSPTRRARRRSTRCSANSPAPASSSSRSAAPRSRRGFPAFGRDGPRPVRAELHGYRRRRPCTLSTSPRAPKAGARLVTGARLTRRRARGRRLAADTRAGDFEAECSSMPPAPGPTPSPGGRRSRRSASSPIAAPSPSCGSIRPRRPTCHSSSMRSAASISSPRRADGSGSARTTRRRRAPCDCAPEELDVAHRHRPARAGGRLAGRAGRAALGRPQELRARPPAGLRLRARAPRFLLVCRAGRLRHPDRARRREAGRVPLLLGSARRLGRGDRSRRPTSRRAASVN